MKNHEIIIQAIFDGDNHTKTKDVPYYTDVREIFTVEFLIYYNKLVEATS